MDIQVNPAQLAGSISAPTSKTEAHRMLIAAALMQKPIELTYSSISEDIEATISCLEHLGVSVEPTAAGCVVDGLYLGKQSDSSDDPCHLFCRESGSTLRFMLPLASTLKSHCVFHLEGSLALRPHQQSLDILTTYGCTYQWDDPHTLHIMGSLDFTQPILIPAQQTSQLISGFLFAHAAHLLDTSQDQITFDAVEPLVSEPYIATTSTVLTACGFDITQRSLFDEASQQQVRRFTLTLHPHDALPQRLHVGADWSNGAFWLAASALAENPLSVRGLDVHADQADTQALDLFARFGVQFIQVADTLIARASQLQGCTVDIEHCPDLCAPLALLALYAEGTTHIKGAARLAIKESNRLESIAHVLRICGASVEVHTDGLVIEGTGMPQPSHDRIQMNCSHLPTEISCHSDHRIAMLAALASSFGSEPHILIGADCVKKSYPHFFDDLASITQLGTSWRYV